MDKPVYLSKKVTENSNITDEGILVYVALRTKYYFQKWHFSRDMIHYEDLLWILMEDDKYTKNYLKKIKDGLENLDKLKIIHIEQRYKNKDLITFQEMYFFTTSKKEGREKEEIDSATEKTEPFTILYLREIHTIMKSDEKFKDKLLRYFIAKVGTIYHGNNQISFNGIGFTHVNNVGAISQKYVSDIAHIKEKAAQHYDKWLEEHGLLIILRSSGKIVDNKTRVIVNGFPNCYARPENIKELDFYFNQREKERNNMHDEIIQLSKNANKNRSHKQSYNAYKRGNNCDFTKVIVYLGKQLQEHEKILKAKRKHKSDDWGEVFETKELIYEIKQDITDLCWNLFLDGRIMLEEGSLER